MSLSFPLSRVLSSFMWGRLLCAFIFTLNLLSASDDTWADSNLTQTENLIKPPQLYSLLYREATRLLAAREAQQPLKLEVKFESPAFRTISEMMLAEAQKGSTLPTLSRLLHQRIYDFFNTPQMVSWATKQIGYISDELKSPFCPGKTLTTCTSPNALKLRQEMTQQLLSGYHNDEILESLRKRFGDDIDNPPQPWYTILLPLLPFIFGAFIAVWMLSRWLSSSQNTQIQREAELDVAVDAAHQDRLNTLLKDDD